MQLGDRDGMFCFILQDVYERLWAENMMLLLTVRQLDPWWAHVSALNLAGRFGTSEPQAPAVQPWGLRVAFFHDPPPASVGMSPSRTAFRSVRASR